MAKTKNERERLIKSSNRLSYSAGLMSGMAGLRRSRSARVLGTMATLTGIGAFVQNARASEGVGEFIGREIGNFGRSFVGATAGVVGTRALVKGLRSKGLRNAARAAGSKTRSATDKLRMAAQTMRARAARGKNAKNVNVVFRRIGGRVVPIREK